MLLILKFPFAVVSLAARILKIGRLSVQTLGTLSLYRAIRNTIGLNRLGSTQQTLVTLILFFRSSCQCPRITRPELFSSGQEPTSLLGASGIAQCLCDEGKTNR